MATNGFCVLFKRRGLYDWVKLEKKDLVKYVKNTELVQFSSVNYDEKLNCNGCDKCWKGYSGAGVILVTSNNELVLVREKRSKKYSDAGGNIQDDVPEPSIEMSASNELLEETRNLVKIPAKVLRHYPNFTVKDQTGNHVYRVYFVKKDVSCAEFYESDTRGLDSSFRETDKITKFPIDAALKSISTGKSSIPDTENNQQPLRKRTQKILLKAHRMKIFPQLQNYGVIEDEY